MVEKYNHLTFIKETSLRRNGKKICTWKCDCGNEINVVYSDVKSGNTKSCGCIKGKLRRINMIGKKFGKLEVMKYAGEDKHGHLRWICKCDCGKTTHPIDGAFLRNGTTKSCGCISYTGIASRNLAIGRIKRGATRRGISFKLTDEQVLNLITQHCYYCGEEASNTAINQKIPTEIFRYNGIDRVDSNMGYEKGNVVPCCKTCNLAKNAMSQDDFYSWIDRVYNYSIA